MAGEQQQAEQAIRDVEEAVSGDKEEAKRNQRAAARRKDPLDDRTAHTRVGADGAARDGAHPDPDARVDPGAEDDTYKRTRGL
jgi:hypothetical protein